MEEFKKMLDDFQQEVNEEIFALASVFIVCRIMLLLDGDDK